MKRILLPALLAALMLLAACGGEPEKKETAQTAGDAPVQAEPVKLTYANFPPAFTVPCVQMEHWKEEVQTRTQGAVIVETFPGGSLLKSKNMLRGVIEGQADIGCLSMSYQPGVFPLTTAVEMPVGFSSAKVSSQVLWALFEKYQPAEFAQVKVLTLFATPPSNVMSTVPVQSLADLQGLELRGGGTPAKFLELLGAVPVNMPMPETPDALQKNIVKGLFSSLEVLQDMKFAEYCPNVTTLNGPAYIFAVVMNQAKWDSLPEEVKKTLDTLAPEQAAWTGEYWDKHTADAVEWSVQNHKLQSFTLTPEEMAQVAEKTAGITAAWKEAATAAGVPAEEVFADLLTFKSQFEAN
ncbi:MAG: TRAP transporter substrate-binding protein [Desulfovibrionaceae bacterium]